MKKWKILLIKDHVITWRTGRLEGVQLQYAILADALQLNVGEKITQDIKAQDRSADFLYIDEIELQQQQAAEMQIMINQMLFDPKDSEQDIQINQTQTMLNNLMLGGL